MAGEQRIIEYINQHIAPDYGPETGGGGVQDPVQADRAGSGRSSMPGRSISISGGLNRWWTLTALRCRPTVPVFQWAFGIYSDRYSSVQALPNGATIVVPDDGANQGQALLAAPAHWVDLARPGGWSRARRGKLKNIVGNPHQFCL